MHVMPFGPFREAECNPVYGKLFAACFGRSKSALNSPSVTTDTVEECSSMYACLIAPFSDRHRLAVVCQEVIVSAVALLLLWGCPAAIFRLVIATVVDAVEAVLWRWAMTHVIQERSKSVPATAYLYAATTIVSVTGMARVAASLPHFLPHFVFRDVFQVGRKQDRIGFSHERSPGTVCGENRQWGHNPVAFRFLYHS